METRTNAVFYRENYPEEKVTKTISNIELPFNLYILRKVTSEVISSALKELG